MYREIILGLLATLWQQKSDSLYYLDNGKNTNNLS